MSASLRHGGAEVKSDCAESFDRLGLMKSVVSEYLSFAHAWMTTVAETAAMDTAGEDQGSDEVDDPGWEPRAGGSCNFIMCDP
jgi:hypothetical protein